MKIKRIIAGGIIVATSVAALTGCSRLSQPEAKIDEAKRNKSYTESMLYVNSYNMNVALDNEANSLAVKVSADLYNNTGEAFDELLFRLPAAAALNSKGGQYSWEVTGAYFGKDEAKELSYTVDPSDPTIIKLSLGDNKLESQKDAVVTISVREDIPEDDMRFGLLKVNGYDEYVLSGCFPQAVEFRDDEWVINDIDWTGESISADTAFSQATDYHVEMELPEKYNAIGTGSELKGDNTTTINAVDVRDFAVVVSNGLISSYWANGDLVIRYHYIEGSKAEESGQETVSWRVPSGMDWMEDSFKKYPWNQYDIVNIYSDQQTKAYPGILLIGDKSIYDGFESEKRTAVLDSLKDVNAKGLFEQWFGVIVGCNEEYDGWLTKGLLTWLNDYASVKVYGTTEDRQIGETLKEIKKQYPDAMDMKLTDLFPDGKTADIVNSYRGAEFLEELYTAMGDKEFMSALKDYFTSYEFKEADTEGFLNIMKSHTQKDIQNIVDSYF